MAARYDPNSGPIRLTGWKAIADFLGRTERTVKRWETSRGLPIRRVPGSGRPVIFAYAHELQHWLDSGQAAEEPEAGVPAEAVSPGSRVRLWLGVATAAAIAVLGAVVWSAPPKSDSPRDRIAAEDYAAGLHAWQTRSPSGVARAIADFSAAVRRDPGYAEAYAQLANAFNVAPEFGTMPVETAYASAHAAALRAIEIDPSLGSAHAALAFSDFYWLRDVAGARREFERSIALDPRNATAHHWYATFLMTRGDFRAALGEIDKAGELDSESTAIQADRALILFYCGNRQRAVTLLEQIETDQPLFASPHLYLGLMDLVLHNDRDYLREIAAYARAKKDQNIESVADSARVGYLAGGRTTMMNAVLRTQLSLYAKSATSAYSIAQICGFLNQPKDAVRWLSASYARQEPQITIAKVDPAFEAIRGDREFRSMVTRIGI